MFGTALVRADVAFSLSCQPRGECVPLENAHSIVNETIARLRRVKELRVSTLNPRFVPPLVVFPPAPRNTVIWNKNEPLSLHHYTKKFKHDLWLGPVIRVYRTFFANRASTDPAQRGFFVEAGGLDGGIGGSNSYLFERFLGWNGLMVEANQLNFAQLLRARPGVTRAETALCPAAGNLSFAGGSGCCTGVAGNPSRHLGNGLRDGKWGDAHVEPRSSAEYKVRCTAIGPLLRALRISKIDFWSLDVEASEYAVLSGMDWDIPVSVLLVERCKGSCPPLLKSKGFVRSMDAEFTTPWCRPKRDAHDCPRDKVYYHPERIRPLTTAQVRTADVTRNWNPSSRTF
jgi:hypothetical protein